jgi:hypothetical protein
MGRNMFGPIRGDWGDEQWTGWWGDDPPYHELHVAVALVDRRQLVRDPRRGGREIASVRFNAAVRWRRPTFTAWLVIQLGDAR